MSRYLQLFFNTYNWKMWVGWLTGPSPSGYNLNLSNVNVNRGSILPVP
jgi:hypothetical protein